MPTGVAQCALCIPQDVVVENELAFARYDDNSLSPGHVLIVPRRHVANFFDMTIEEKHAVISLLDQAKEFIENLNP
jgi:diadenosine tetraphosphate (Ap4A) HIT family hydrolase